MLLARVRGLDKRIVDDLLDLLRLLVEEEVDAEVDVVTQPTVFVSRVRVVRMIDFLEKTEPDLIKVFRVTGRLFRIDSKSMRFRLEPDAGGEFQGTWDHGMEEEIRSAWGRRVTVEVEQVEQRIARQADPVTTKYHLVRIIQVFTGETGSD